jgi:hypothetical protein
MYALNVLEAGWRSVWIVRNHKPAGNMPSVDLQPARDQEPFKVKVGESSFNLKSTIRRSTAVTERTHILSESGVMKTL